MITTYKLKPDCLSSQAVGLCLVRLASPIGLDASMPFGKHRGDGGEATAGPVRSGCIGVTPCGLKPEGPVGTGPEGEAMGTDRTVPLSGRFVRPPLAPLRLATPSPCKGGPIALDASMGFRSVGTARSLPLACCPFGGV